jgi:hypothetical protein
MVNPASPTCTREEPGDDGVPAYNNGLFGLPGDLFLSGDELRERCAECGGLSVVRSDRSNAVREGDRDCDKACNVAANPSAPAAFSNSSFLLSLSRISDDITVVAKLPAKARSRL